MNFKGLYDFRLKAFIAAATCRNFTKAAEQLFISQPAVSSHIVALEKEFGVTLFDRRGSLVTLTPAGERLLQYARKVDQSYQELNYQMGLCTGQMIGDLRVGASTTIAQYLLPLALAKMEDSIKGMNIILSTANSEQIEKALFDGVIDMGIVENASRRSGLTYHTFMKDELVLIAAADSIFALKDEISQQELKTIPLVLRENGSGTLEVIEKKLLEKRISLKNMNIKMHLGSTEAIKLFIKHSESAAIVSIISVRDDIQAGKFKVIDIEGCDFPRNFTFVTRQGEENPRVKEFQRLLKSVKL